MPKFPCELTLDQLLDDPLTQAVMKADRVDPSTLAVMLRRLAVEIADATPPSAGTARNPVARLARWVGALPARAVDRLPCGGGHSQLCGAP